jgi:hypothetical protein
MDEVHPEPNPEPRSDESKGDAAIENQMTTTPDSFGVFRKYSSLSSHNPEDIDPFSNTPSTSSNTGSTLQPPTSGPIGSNLSASPARTDLDPLANSENPTVHLLLSWYSRGSMDGAGGLDHLVKCIQNPRFDASQLKDFNAVSALRQFEKKHLGSKPGNMLSVSHFILAAGHDQGVLSETL